MNEIKKTINTRLVLRNADLEAWKNSDKVLLKGEMALAKLDGAYNDCYSIRIGTGDKIWNQLSDVGQIVISSQYVEGLKYDQYDLVKQTTVDGEVSGYQFKGKKSGTDVWEDVGAVIDIKTVTDSISSLNDRINNIIDSTIPAVKEELSNALSTYTDDKAKELTNLIDDVSAETLISAYANASQQASTALAQSKEYTNEVSSSLSSIFMDKIKDGIHFMGKVYSYGVEDHKGYYQKEEGGQKIPANNGDLIIHGNVEYVYSESDENWIQLGDEGTWASKAYVDTAKEEAISSTQNVVKYFDTKLSVEGDDPILSVNYGTNTGDIAIVKQQIGTTGKYEYTAYVWDKTLEQSNKWKAMDGNYSAENVFLANNMTITEKFGKYDIGTSGSTVLTCAGMSIKSFINDAFSQTKHASQVKPTAEFTGVADIGSTNKEVGEWATGLPQMTFKYTKDGYYSTYNNNLTAGNICKLSSVILKREAIASEDIGDPSRNIFNVDAISAIISSDSTENVDVGSTVVIPSVSQNDVSVQYKDSSITLAKYNGYAEYLSGTTIPKNNIGDEDPDNIILSGSWSKSWQNVSLPRGNRYGFYGYRMFSEGPIATTDGTVKTFDRTKITSDNIRNDIHAIKFVANDNSVSWPTKFTVKGGSQQIIFAIPHNSYDWNNHKYIKMSNIALGTYQFENNGLLYTDTGLKVEGANKYDSIDYDIWCINPTGEFDSDTEYTIEYGNTQKQ